MRRFIRSLLREESGYTMVELLSAMTAALVVIGIPIMLSIHSMTDQQNVQDISTAQRSLEQGMARLTSDFRQATAATVSSTSSVTLTVPIPVSQRTVASNPVPPAGTTVTWTCTIGASCTRASSGGVSEPLINNVTAVTFTPRSSAGSTTIPQTNPVYVDVSVSTKPYIKSRPGGLPSTAPNLTLASGIDLRNMG